MALTKEEKKKQARNIVLGLGGIGVLGLGGLALANGGLGNGGASKSKTVTPKYTTSSEEVIRDIPEPEVVKAREVVDKVYRESVATPQEREQKKQLDKLNDTTPKVEDSKEIKTKKKPKDSILNKPVSVYGKGIYSGKKKKIVAKGSNIDNDLKKNYYPSYNEYTDNGKTYLEEVYKIKENNNSNPKDNKYIRMGLDSTKGKEVGAIKRLIGDGSSPEELVAARNILLKSGLDPDSISREYVTLLPEDQDYLGRVYKNKKNRALPELQIPASGNRQIFLNKKEIPKILKTGVDIKEGNLGNIGQIPYLTRKPAFSDQLVPRKTETPDRKLLLEILDGKNLEKSKLPSPKIYRNTKKIQTLGSILGKVF